MYLQLLFDFWWGDGALLALLLVLDGDEALLLPTLPLGSSLFFHLLLLLQKILHSNNIPIPLISHQITSEILRISPINHFIIILLLLLLLLPFRLPNFSIFVSAINELIYFRLLFVEPFQTNKQSKRFCVLTIELWCPSPAVTIVIVIVNDVSGCFRVSGWLCLVVGFEYWWVWQCLMGGSDGFIRRSSAVAYPFPHALVAHVDWDSWFNFIISVENIIAICLGFSSASLMVPFQRRNQIAQLAPISDSIRFDSISLRLLRQPTQFLIAPSPIWFPSTNQNHNNNNNNNNNHRNQLIMSQFSVSIITIFNSV